MRSVTRFVTVTLASGALVVAAGAAAVAGSPATGLTGAVGQAAVTTAGQEQALGYWTPERMRDAVPLAELAGDLVDTLPAEGSPVAGAPVEIGATMPATSSAPDGAGVQAFPHSGGPWTGGGDVVPTSGRVFFTTGGQNASCSGNAVTSANRSTVLTAGHCVKLNGSFHTNWVFVPAYNNGNAPFGTWAADQVFVTPQWNDVENINFDMGAAKVSPLGGQLLTDVVGGQGVAFNQPRGLAMYAFGFPAAAPYDGTRLIYCSGNTFNDFLLTTQLGMTCDQTGGASGGPWFRSFSEATGTGLQNSVNSFKYVFFSGWMFGPYFGADTQNVYQAAQSA